MIPACSSDGFHPRGQGRWEESIRNLERAVELDPRNVTTLFQRGLSYGAVRRYAEQKSKLDRILTIDPNDVAVKADRAFVEVDWKADTGPLHQLIDEIRATNPAAMPKIADGGCVCALAERDVAAAKDALIAADEITLGQTLFISRVLSRKALSRAWQTTSTRRNWLLLLRARSRRKPSRLNQITARHGACSE